MRIPLFILLIVIGACTKPQHRAGLATAPVDTSNLRERVDSTLAFEEFINLHYGDDSLQTIDLYLPKGRTADTTHILVFIHGGGWMGSDKSDYTNSIDSMKHVTASYAYVNINYRLVADGKNQFPTAEEDVQAALEYVWKRVDSFHISPRTGIIGVSAGAHLTALEAYKHNEKGYIKAITLFFGVYNMAAFYEQGSAGVPQLSVMVLGGTPQEKPEIYKSSSPLNFVTANSPATLLIHGTEDTLARYRQSVELDSVLQRNGVAHDFFSFKGWHGVSAESIDEAAYKMFTWIAKYTK